MKEFKFIVDRKIALWVRTNIYVEGTDQEDAEEKLLRKIRKNNDCIYDYMENGDEYLYETEQTIKPQENSDKATIEIFKENPYTLENRIYSNAEASEM